MNTKKPYVEPRLKRYGTVAELTKTAGTGAGDGLTGRSASTSDVAVKRSMEQVDADRLLRRLAELPVTTWRYEWEPDGVRHLGPTAQDFAAAFGLGDDDRLIYNVDAAGVAMAAIKALEQQLAQMRAEIAQLRREVERREDRRLPDSPSAEA